MIIVANSAQQLLLYLFVNKNVAIWINKGPNCWRGDPLWEKGMEVESFCLPIFTTEHMPCIQAV